MTKHRLIAIFNQTAVMAMVVALVAYIFSRALLMVGVYLAIGTWIAARMLERKRWLPATSLNWPLALVALTLILSVFFGTDWHEGLRGLNKWLRGLLVFWLAYDLTASEKTERKWIIAMAIAFLAASLDGIFQYFTHHDFIRGYSVGYTNTLIRLTSSFGYFGMFASFLLMATPVAFVAASGQKRKGLRIFLIILFLALAAINLYLTRSRGAWISLIGMLIILFIALRQWEVLAGFILLSALLPFFLPQNLLLHHPKASGIDKTINHRMMLWQEAIEVTKQFPITGCGLNTYVQNVEQYSPYKNKEVKRYYAHNGYLQHTAETGLLGLLALLFLLGQYGIQAMRQTAPNIHGRKRALSIALTMSVFGFLFYVFFDTIFHNLQPFLLFWFLLGWSLRHLDRQQEAILR